MRHLVGVVYETREDMASEAITLCRRHNGEQRETRGTLSAELERCGEIRISIFFFFSFLFSYSFFFVMRPLLHCIGAPTIDQMRTTPFPFPISFSYSVSLSSLLAPLFLFLFLFLILI